MHIRLPKRFCIVICVLVLFLLLFGPSYFRYIFFHRQEVNDRICSDEMVPRQLFEIADNLDAIIDDYIPYERSNNNYLQFVGNGYLAVVIHSLQSLFIKRGRTLSLLVPYNPVVTVQRIGSYTNRKSLDYKNGISYLFGCYDDRIHVTYEYYAHRTILSVFVQEIKVHNLYYNSLSVDLVQKDGYPAWNPISIRTIKITEPETKEHIDYVVVSGTVSYTEMDVTKTYIVCIVTRKFPLKIHISAYETQKVTILTSVKYVPYVKRGSDDLNKRQVIETAAIEEMKLALEKKLKGQLKEEHVDGWHKLWNSGISISNSKALGSFNGDLYNATMYYVLSSVQYDNSPKQSSLINLSMLEGCYRSNHHTLQADNLWRQSVSLIDVVNSVDLWLLTLEKQGCDNLLKVGAEGVLQAIVLSAGGFQFTENHLSFNMHPQFLHRNFHFRNINFGNLTKIDVGVEVSENNKAILFVSVDSTDTPFYACDGGCLDEPIKLTTTKALLPVKLTNPFTAILYITPDKQHLHDLRHTLHVKDVLEAPAQEHSMLILHRHGHHLRGLPTFFWVAIVTLVIIFHLFLIKLIYTEYKNSNNFPRQNDVRIRSNSKYKCIDH